MSVIPKYPLVRIELKPSKFLPDEIGVFATRRIAKGEVIVPVAHFSDVRLVEWNVFDTLDALTKKKIMDYCPGTAGGFFAPADLNFISVAWQMNHSCQPNVGYNDGDDFIAMRAIKRGEELRWDYAYAESNPKFRMKCRCGAENCRGVVTGTDWKKLLVDDKCYRYFSSSLKDFIASYPNTNRSSRPGAGYEADANR